MNLAEQLTRSIGIVEENERLRAENAKLRRDLGKARLLADLRQDLADLEFAADNLPVSMFHKRQAE